MEIAADEVVLGSTGVSANEVVAVARRGATVTLGQAARDAMLKAIGASSLDALQLSNVFEWMPEETVTTSPA